MIIFYFVAFRPVVLFDDWYIKIHFSPFCSKGGKYFIFDLHLNNGRKSKIIEFICDTI